MVEAVREEGVSVVVIITAVNPTATEVEVVEEEEEEEDTVVVGMQVDRNSKLRNRRRRIFWI